MYRSIKGIYENGQITLNEKLSMQDKVDVIVTFLSKEEAQELKNAKRADPKEAKINPIPSLKVFLFRPSRPLWIAYCLH